jgi:hypothetical protein
MGKFLFICHLAIHSDIDGLVEADVEYSLIMHHHLGRVIHAASGLILVWFPDPWS